MKTMLLVKKYCCQHRQVKWLTLSVLFIVLLPLLLSGCVKKSEVTKFELKAAKIITSEKAPLINIDSIAVTENQIFVSDIHQVKVFDQEGQYLHSIGEKGHADGQFAGEVIGVAINSKNKILAVDMENYRVQIFDAEGNFIRKFGEKGSLDGQFLQPQGILVDKYDLIYVTDKLRSDVQVFSPKGEFLYRIARKGNGASDLLEPESMAMRDEKLYIADEGNFRIQVFTPRGVYIEQLPRMNMLISPQMESSMDDIPYQTEIDKLYDRKMEGDIEGIAFDNKGLLYVMDEDGGAVNIIKQGNVIASFTAETGLKSADGIAFSFDYQYLYVCDQANARVLVFDVSEIRRRISN